MTFSIAFYMDSVPFTAGVLSGTTSLGGSESACIGLARALAKRGHQVSIYAKALDPDCKGRDAAGVTWWHAEELHEPDGFQDWDVFCSLRMPSVFYERRTARLRILWNQDLMNVDAYKNKVMASAWAYDKVAYVSDYHRKQWEEWLPELKPLGYVTRNGFDPIHVPTGVVKKPNQIIHISRPERGLEPLLEMWPLLKYHVPDAELKICRYSSMYDAAGWGKVCDDYDRRVVAVNEQIGGITYLGELGKPDLYRAIAESAVMWYPGVPSFAETSCIAAIEAQACGTPFVGSLKGALPETIPGGVLIPGDAFSREYQVASVAAVVKILQGDTTQVAEGLYRVKSYTHDAIAADWEAWITETFEQRYEANKIGVLRQLLHYDDHTAAEIVAHDILDTENSPEATAALELCARVHAGLEQTSEQYAERAAKPLEEAEKSDRFKAILGRYKDCTHVLDLACGPGSFALALTRMYPDIRVTAVDYSAPNIAVAKAAAAEWGVLDRCTFVVGPVYDYEKQIPHTLAEMGLSAGPYDGAFIGEFLEHVAEAPKLIDAVETFLEPGSPIVYTVPYGPMIELLPRSVPNRRGHAHHFTARDLNGLFSQKTGYALSFLGWSGVSARGQRCGTQIISYLTNGDPTGRRPYDHQIVTTRPRLRLSVGIIAKDAEFEIGKCLEGVWGIADEIVIGLCGSTDKTRAIAEAFDLNHERVSKIRFVDLPAVEKFREGFAGARNAVLNAATGDWFLWIDTDELLLHSYNVDKYLEGGAFRGYVIHQNHLQIDAPNHHDTPVRIFRPQDVQFYGCIHEQPQWKDCNGDIEPSLEVYDVQIAHTGYLVTSIRRHKMLERNLPLVARDQEVFPDRRLGKVILLRDCVNLADEECRMHDDKLTPDAHGYYSRAIQLFTDYFADPADKHHELARPFYERALQGIGAGTEVEWALAGKPGGLNGQHAKPHRFWVQTPEEFERIVTHKTKKAVDQMKPPTVHVDPYVETRESVTV